MKKPSKPSGKTKYTIEFTEEERRGLERKAAKERIKVAQLLRRYAVGIISSIFLIGCGGGDFSSPPVANPGAGSGSADMAGRGSLSGSGGSSGRATSGGSGGIDPSLAGSGSETGAWSGKSYFISVPAKSWTSPRGIGNNIIGIAPDLLLSISGDGDALTVLVSTAAGGSVGTDGKVALTTAGDAIQDMCTPTTYAALDASSYPSSELGPLDVRAHVVNTGVVPNQQVTATLYALHMSNVLPDDSGATGSLDATVDMRELYILFASLGPSRTPDSVCKAFGDAYTSSDCTADSCKVQCEACSDGQTYCLKLTAENVVAEDISLPIQELDGSARAKTCADSPKPSAG